MQLNSKLYLRVDLALVQDIGANAAILYAFIIFVAKKRQKDIHGFFSIETKYICQNLGLARNTLIRHRSILIKRGLIELRQGSNQNAKSYYKITTNRH